VKFKSKDTGGLPIRFIGQDRPKAPFTGVDMGMGEKDKNPLETKVSNIKK